MPQVQDGTRKILQSQSQSQDQDNNVLHQDEERRPLFGNSNRQTFFGVQGQRQGQDENYSSHQEEDRRPLFGNLSFLTRHQGSSRYTRSQHYQLYQAERNFRLNRLGVRYPRYIQQSHIDRWTRPDYDGVLAEDSHFVSLEPIVNTSSGRSSTGSSGNFGSFGGGSSGGGGGGTW